ncbi:MAG: hypothetical protein SFW65_00125 [Alphaproteobacteria bacterium]|nr:hypothetical protein [Alphaproteobacteria bacterium]
MYVLRDAIARNSLGKSAGRSSCLKVVLLWMCIMIPVSAMLYGTSSSVREKENELSAIKAQIAAEKDSLRVLRAEWAYLNQPQKLSSRAQRYLVAKKAAIPAQVLSERQVTSKVAYRAATTTVASNGLHIQPAEAAIAPRMLAKPIVYDDHALAALHTQDDAKLPSAVTWSQKVVSAFGFSSEAQNKSRLAP